MNATTNVFTAASADARAASEPREVVNQPLVPADQQLLKTAYPHGGLLLDLHGALDQHGYDVQAVSITGAGGPLVDVVELFSRQELTDMSAWCDRHLPSAHQLLLVSQREVQAERRKWARQFV